jgi:hypothetical protein
MFKRIWKDPVWSKVIAGVLLAVGSLIYALIKSSVANISVKTTLQGLFEINIRVLYILLIILFWLIIRAIFWQNGSYLTRKKRKFLRHVRGSLDDDGTGLIFKWTNRFNGDKPVISDLKAYCNLHDKVPFNLVNARCPASSCPNSVHGIDFEKTLAVLESYLVEAWEKEKNKNNTTNL